MRDYKMIDREERKDKICNICKTDKSVKYKHKGNKQYYCNLCVVDIILEKIEKDTKRCAEEIAKSLTDLEDTERIEKDE